MSPNLARTLCGIFQKPPECVYDAHLTILLCLVPGCWLPDLHAISRNTQPSVCVWDALREKKQQVKSLTDAYVTFCLKDIIFSWLLSFSPTSQTLIWDLQSRFEMWSGRTSEARTKSETGGWGGRLLCQEAMPPGGHRGELWLCSGLPKPAGGGEGGKIHCSKAMAKRER
jgi:hypothetical protein